MLLPLPLVVVAGMLSRHRLRREPARSPRCARWVSQRNLPTAAIKVSGVVMAATPVAVDGGKAVAG